MPPFVKQTDQPLFSDILWNHPVGRTGSGKLVLVGGRSGQFSVLQAAYQAALAAGLAGCRVVVPDSLRPVLGGTPNSHFAPTAPGGNLSRMAAPLIQQLASDTQGLLIGPNLSASSDATILTETLIRSSDKPVILADDALAAIRHQTDLWRDRPNTLIIATMPEIFKIAGALGIPISVKPDAGVLNKVAIMSDLLQHSQCSWVLFGRDLVVASQGQCSVTTAVSAMDFFLPAAYGTLSAFYLLHPTKSFEALTTGAYVLAKARAQVAQADENQPLLLEEITAAIRGSLQ